LETQCIVYGDDDVTTRTHSLQRTETCTEQPF